MTLLERPVTSLSGVGPERAAQLARLEIWTVEDLLLHRPRDYEDRRQLKTIRELQLGDAASTRGKIVTLGVKWYARHTKSIFELILDDGTARLYCHWWNLPFMEKQFKVGEELVVYGKLRGLKPRTMDHPETEIIESGEEGSIHFNRITPIYPLTEGVPQRWLRSLIWRTLGAWETQSSEEQVVTPEAFQLPRTRAIRMLHFPENPQEPEIARERLALDEFVAWQIRLQERRRKFEVKSQALPCGGDNRLIRPFLAHLGFKLTGAQTRVLREVRQDLSGRHPMRRLLQGDVGSGKTAVAACSALMAIESGFDVALMAPTEILAGQHFANFSQWFKPFGVAVELQTGSRRTGGGNRTRAPRDPGTLYIGTHALLEAGFAPEKLGLVIIDEQHKFGVTQREELVRKGQYPHLLVMTATPIPRTLGLTLYGDLDVSVIDESPPGRGKVRTFVREAEKLPAVWDFIRGKLAKGRQTFVVYPRVEESGAAGMKAVTKEFAGLQKALAPFSVGMLHGKIGADERENTIGAFRAGTLKVLLATALIEVGLDIPNATIMLIENAEQFGLAQLHQLRGRVGRGASESYCILIASAKTPEARRRLKVLEDTTDGFRIAEADLALRGPGDMLGQQQSGMPRLKFGDLSKDLELIRRARDYVANVPSPKSE